MCDVEMVMPQLANNPTRVVLMMSSVTPVYSLTRPSIEIAIWMGAGGGAVGGDGSFRRIVLAVAEMKSSRGSRGGGGAEGGDVGGAGGGGDAGGGLGGGGEGDNQ